MGQSLDIHNEGDVVRVRQQVRQAAVELGFSLVEQTKMVTAASELARNALIHGGSGRCELELLQANGRRGLQLSFIDEGPGIADVSMALRDGYTTGSGLGLGLGGAKRLVSDFEIESAPGKGTRIRVVRWK